MYTWVNKIAVRPNELEPNTAAAIKVVAKVGWGNDWAAYLGPSDWSDEKVADEGDKILEKAARILFPSFAHLRYRD